MTNSPILLLAAGGWNMAERQIYRTFKLLEDVESPLSCLNLTAQR